MKLLQKGNTPNISIETWICDTVEEIQNLPNSVPVGSVVIIPSDEGITAKIKNNAGQWKPL